DAPTLLHNGLGTEMRTFLGGVLHQEPERVVEAREPWSCDIDARSACADAPASQIRVVTKRQPTAEEWTALRFAWRLCAHVKSNTLLFTRADRSFAIGAGQVRRGHGARV